MSDRDRHFLLVEYGMQVPDTDLLPVRFERGVLPFAHTTQGAPFVSATRIFRGAAGAGTHTMSPIVLPVGAVVTTIIAAVAQVFDGDTAVINVGTTGNADAYIDDQDATSAGFVALAAGALALYGVRQTTELTITGTVVTTGAATATGIVTLEVGYQMANVAQAAALNSTFVATA